MSVRRIEGEEAERLAVRHVAVSASQIQALESLARAFSGLMTDFWHDYGVDHDDRIAGGLYRLCSTLEMIVEEWRSDSDDVAVVEGYRQALEQIAFGELTFEQARRLAARALQLPDATE